MLRSALLFLALSLTARSVAAQQAPHDSLQGAVRLVDTGSRTLEVTTGVGFALRAVRLEVPVGVPVVDKRQDAPLALRDLKPGDVIRVRFGQRLNRDVAYSIERVGRMETGPHGAP